MEMPLESFKCHMVSWDDAYRLAKILAHKIKSSGFKPDIVVGIARGGLVPARIVCDFLLQKDLVSMKVEHWGIASTLGKAKIKYPLPINVKGKNILVVDDVADTGDTYSETVDYIKSMAPEDVRTAVLHYKTSSSFVPDYWGEKHEEWKWIIYPWAVYEDIEGFVEKVMVKPMTQEALRKNLKTIYDIGISRNNLHEILIDMFRSGKLKMRKKGKKVFWEPSDNVESGSK